MIEEKNETIEELRSHQHNESRTGPSQNPFGSQVPSPNQVSIMSMYQCSKNLRQMTTKWKENLYQ